MKTREKGCHYGIVLFALANILIGFSGYVCAAPSNGAVGPEVQKVKEKVESGPTGTDDDEDEKEKEAWRKLEIEPKGESEYEKQQLVNDFGPPVEENLNGLIAIVSWRKADNKINLKKYGLGWYDTIGTVISRSAIICMPSIQLKSKEPAGQTEDYYAKAVLLRLDDVGARKVITKRDFVVYFNDKPGVTRNVGHRMAMVVLNKPLGDDIKTARLVMNPLMPPPPPPPDMRSDSPTTMQYDDFAVTACTMLVFNLEPKTLKTTVVGIPTIATKCMVNEGPAGMNLYYESKICVHVKVPYSAREMLSDRTKFPQDVGAPLFCNNHLTGMYTGVMNLEGNSTTDMVAETLSDIMFGARLNGPDEQYTFEVPGMARTWEFITSFTGDAEDKVEFSSFMPVMKDEICLPPPESVGSTTEVPETGGGGGGEEGPNTPRPGPGESAAKPANRGEKESSKSKATPTFQLSPLFAVAALGTITMTSLSERC